MTATGIGSYPGESLEETLRTVLGELPDLPHLPELPDRGITAGIVGRGLAVMAELGADLQPAGWRLTDAPGVDHRRARSLLAQDLDTLEELTQGYEGAFKIQVAGPWTLAASVEKPRGDKVLSDFGARRELAQALAEGVGTHVADVRRRLPGVDRLVVQVDEPALSAVLAGKVPTASGFGRHRTVHPPEASEALSWVLGAVSDAGAEPWVHTCAAGTPLPLLRTSGARGISVDLGLMTAADHDALAEALEDGETVALGVVPSLDPATAPTDTEVTERVLRWLDMLGLDPAEVGEQLVVTPTCGLAGASPAWVRQALALVRTSAANLSG
ncbi:methionine synthase [Nocardioides sp. Root1257]|uniref:methionine synthase n=1 Tax=unclassified Nocardioides TaxID=2615069 RepID=UPI000701CEFE|nr:MULTISPECIES: methionine synthase [unclassified Nocardioides]KQW53903.1 methionine synthase [Nocardioides sp. Root1257]KRC56592.1 methionine synthase [Nocardioides sp. Root224]